MFEYYPDHKNSEKAVARYKVVYDVPEAYLPSIKYALAGFGGGIGRIAYTTVEYAIDTLDAVRIVRIFYYDFPPEVVINDGGIIEPICVEIFASQGKNKLLLVTSPTQPISYGHFELSQIILEQLKKMDVQHCYTTASYFPRGKLDRGTRKIYIASSDRNIIKKWVDMNYPIAILEPGTCITGMNGVLPSCAPIYNLAGAIILCETYGYFVDKPDYSAAFSALEALNQNLKLKIDLKELKKVALEKDEQVFSAEKYSDKLKMDSKDVKDKPEGYL